MYSLGIDIGYTAVKVALVDHAGVLRHQRYRLHKGNSQELVRQLMDELLPQYPLPEVAYGAVTGSGAGIFSAARGVASVNAVAALVAGAAAAGTPARSIIEIGGQSTKYITGLRATDRSGIKIAMNSSCSAGTGSFLEEQVSRLNLKLEDYSVYAARAETIPRIAGRCSVFAKTDIIHHQQEGVPVADILLGLAYAVVRNYRVSVMRKLPREKPILLAGGVARNNGIVTALRDVLNLEADELIVPQNAGVFSAVGAARIAAEEQLAINPDHLLGRLARADISMDENGTPLPALTALGRDDSCAKHPGANLDSTAAGLDCYLGLDVGSTSTNLVIADRQDRIIAFRYLRTLGNPLQAVRRGLRSLKDQCGARLNVVGACTTGSGRYMTGRLIGADLIKDEITAQARAAVSIDPAVDTIFEIGGQDSKYIRLEDSAVVDFQMNKICAAGTGSFIEEQAQKLGIRTTDIGAMALAAPHPVNLGERCTVFMETSIVSHLGRGAQIADIMAGLCYAIVKNYLNRVVGRKKVGDKIFLQGGVAYNQGVVNAFRALTGKNVVVPPFFSVTGAYGAAILAREAMTGRQTAFKGFDPAPEERFLDDEKKRKSAAPKASVFNKTVETLVFKGYSGRCDPQKKTVGIPRALFTYGMFSMFQRFFTELGFNVLLSEPTSEKTIASGQAYSLDETCYPVKLINGHVAELINRDVDYIFFPDLYTVDHPGSPARQNYGCAYMQLAFKVVNQAMDLENKGIRLLSPTIAFSLGRDFMLERFSGLGRQLGKTREETGRALQKGVQAFHDFEIRLERAGKAALAKLAPDKKAFVLISKIYGIADPVLNMGIADKLNRMGYPVVPFCYLPEGDLSKEHPNMYWPFGQHILEPAQFVREHPNLYAVLLTHHGCGPDSVLTHYFREEMQGKPYLHIQVDEHSSGVGVTTRVEAFVNSLKSPVPQTAADMAVYRERIVHPDENITPDLGDMAAGTRLYIPPLYPYAEIAAALIRAKGFSAEVLPVTGRDAVDIGRQFTIVEEYFSLTALMGDVFKKCRSQNSGASTAFLVPRTEGAEVDGQYSRLLRTKLDAEGYAHVSVVAPFLEDLLDLETADSRCLFLGLMAGDLVRTAPADHRDGFLGRVIDLVRHRRLTVEALSVLAAEIRREIQNRSWRKRILIVGEPMVLYNDFLNDFLFESIASRGHRVLYAPFSEAMWLLWRDYADQNGKSEKHLRLLDRFAGDIAGIFQCLGPEGPFAKDVAALARHADQSVGYYAGAFGRFRSAKVLAANHHRIDGVITATSTYENTGISLGILHKAFGSRQSEPVLNLTFDGNRNENDVTRCDAFLHYL